MTIQQITTNFTGEAGVTPRIVRVLCNDALATVITAGYLNNSSSAGNAFFPTDIFAISYGTTTPTQGWFVPSISNGVVTLALWNPDAEGATVVGDFANFSTTTGAITDLGFLPTDATKTKVVMANAATVANHLMISTDTAGTVGNKTGTAINDGNLQAGRDTVAGTLISFPSTTATGSLIVAAVSNSGATNTTISNAAMGQASVVSIPDPGASTANFLLDTGTANVLTDNQQIVGLTNILINSVGTWTRTRIAEANYVLRHTAADDTSVIGIDITQAIRTTASKGLRLASVDVIYSIGTLALDAHTLTLDQVSYANNVAVAVTSVPLTGSLSTATQANPYVTNIAVTTPAFLVTADSKYVLELTVNAAATSAYDFYGLNLRFSRTIA